MDALERLITEFAKLPGVGRKTAGRLAYHLLQQPRDRMTSLAQALGDVAERVHPCQGCGAPTEDAECAICSDAPRSGRLTVEELRRQRLGELRKRDPALDAAAEALDLEMVDDG